MRKTSFDTRALVSLTLALGAGALATGCGMDGVVGGACKAGYAEVDGRCLTSPNGGGAPTFETKDPTSPTVTSPESVDPGTTDPKTNPNPPNPVDPNPVDPNPVDPNPVDPNPVDPNPVDPNPVDPNPVDPNPVDPTDPVDPPPPPPVCASPLVLCHGQCISVDADPHNCGACGRICPSNICIAGACVGSTPGDVVVIGHDMRQAWSGSVQARALTNAVSIPTTDPIRVLSYEAGTDADSAYWNRVLVGQGIARQVEFTTATPDALESSALYASYDVVLVHGAANADPASLGGRWGSALQTFTRKGGVFIALDTGTSDVPALVNASGLLALGGHQALPASTRFVVSTPSDVIGAKLLSPFVAFGASVGFTGTEPASNDVAWVVRTDDGAALPTILHKTAR